MKIFLQESFNRNSVYNLSYVYLINNIGRRDKMIRHFFFSRFRRLESVTRLSMELFQNALG